MDIITELKEYGFSEKESKVYVAVLALGEATVNQIAEKSDLIRTTTYDLLKSLKEKGFVSSITKNKVIFFEACNPNKLIETLEEKKSKISKLIPTLSKLREEIPIKPKIEFYEGVNGVKTIFDEILRAKKPLCAYSNNKTMLNLVPYFGPNFIKKRAELKIPIRIISEKSSTTTHLLVEKDKKELRETKILDDLKNIPMNIYIFGDSVAILSSREQEPVAFLINHKDFAHMQRTIFEQVWKKLK